MDLGLSGPEELYLGIECEFHHGGKFNVKLTHAMNGMRLGNLGVPGVGGGQMACDALVIAWSARMRLNAEQGK